MSSVHEGCVFADSLNAAEELLTTGQIEHFDKQTALGGISLARMCLEYIAQRQECTQPTIDQNGNRVCPLRDATLMTRSYAAQPYPKQSYALDLSSLSPMATTDNSKNGMYL